MSGATPTGKRAAPPAPWDFLCTGALHWPEYLIEAGGLCTFMLSASGFGILLEYPGSALHAAIPDAAVRRAIMGAVMGLTAVGIVYSRWGKRSGAHLNPAVTLAFFRLGKIEPVDAVFYIVAQFFGGVLGVVLVARLARTPFADPLVNFVVTVPGRYGPVAAFGGELLISFLLMGAVLIATNRMAIARYTGMLVGILIAVFILLEAPVSGMSMNPARTFGSALPARLWTGLWIYLTAPSLGMLVAAELYRATHRSPPICAKLHHDNDQPCIFRCGYATDGERE